MRISHYLWCNSCQSIFTTSHAPVDLKNQKSSIQYVTESLRDHHWHNPTETCPFCHGSDVEWCEEAIHSLGRIPMAARTPFWKKFRIPWLKRKLRQSPAMLPVSR
ncbi:DUF2572 family protein [Spirulina subsalsa FACHB-351]|uniref:DUF2572 family protein n=1 Tax=Spirulina subsalsa FACHB-351 TaxID=234711 RepID=A0ABT3L4K4_9CYAN|nr:DUF2572 family protein [Spirulina subsalsa]MCW6036440.1 DUF2572 family protein [Spirulina subsalsa FACHB-351]